MKTKYILKGLLVAILLTFTFTSCSYDEPVIDELAVNREFAPVALTARVRNQTIVELNWTVNKNVDHYVVEFSADDPDFNIIFKTVEVTADQLPIQIQLEGLTEYSIRVKAVSAQGRGDSTWAIVTATTLSEQLMLPFEPCGDIQYNEATLRWQPGINVTHIMIQPGDITHNISAQEKADGIAEVTGLVGETDYMATLYNNDKIRGTATFTSEVDPATGTVINTTNDLLQMIASAASGDILLLEPGDYTAQTGTVTLDKSITIRGLLSCDKPLLSVNFEIIGGATDVNLIDLDLDGGTVINDVVRYKGAGNYNSLLVRGCNVHDFARSFIAGSVTDAIVQSVTVENCVVTNILTGGGDFIDFRTSDALNFTVKTSTFNNCAPGRDFLRFDNAGASNNTGLTINILIDSCTLYACSNKDDRRILYVRFVSNDVTVRNTLIAETESEGYADRDGIDESPTFNNNNYFNAEGFYNANQHTYDDGNYTTLDPGFEDAAFGNFTVTNQTLLDNAVGDPRWRQ
jgi:hypothetical protein